MRDHAGRGYQPVTCAGETNTYTEQPGRNIHSPAADRFPVAKRDGYFEGKTTVSQKPCLTLHITRETENNVFCPRCGLIVPRDTKCIASPSNPQVHYHPNCLLTMAASLGRNVVWA